MENEKKYSTVEFAYQTLKGWILSGFLTPGTKIDQDEAAQKMGLSRMPIRNALERLNAERLVIKIPHKGVFVTPISDDDLNSTYDLRAQLESMALILSMRNMTDTMVANLNAMLDLYESVPNPSVSVIMEQNRNFHRSLIQQCRNATLLTMVDNVWEQCERYRRIYFQEPRSNDRVMYEHRMLVSLIAERKVQEASDFLIEHTRASQRLLLSSLSKEIAPLIFKPLILTPEQPE